MGYVPPFSQFKRKMRMSAANGKQGAQLDYEDLVGFIKLMLRGVPVDEAWYLKQNPDVAEAISHGMYRSAKHHFVEDGYFEGRTPFEFKVDENWYSQTYQDVADGIKAGSLESAKQHFLSHGYIEGRLPSPEY